MEAIHPLSLPLWSLDRRQGRLLPFEQWPDDIFLFRNWFDDQRSVKLQPDLGFMAHKQNNPAREDVQSQVYHHVDLKTESSPYISTTLSFFWALARGYAMAGSSQTNGQPIKISIIQASLLDPTTMLTSLDHLPQYTSPKHPFVDQVRRFADHSQEILVLKHIPDYAVLGTLTFQSDLSNLRELPWMDFTTTPLDEKFYAWQYAEKWARKFRGCLDSEELDLDTHAANCLDLALRFLNEVPVVTDSGALSECTLHLATYLYLWPFRKLPLQSRGQPLPRIEMPTRQDALGRIRGCWRDVNENWVNPHDVDGLPAEDDAEDLVRALARLMV